MLFSEWLFTPAGLEPVLKVRPLFREFLAQIGIIQYLNPQPQPFPPTRGKSLERGFVAMPANRLQSLCSMAIRFLGA